MRQAGLLTQSRTNTPLKSRPEGRGILSARHCALMEFSILSGLRARGVGRGSVGNLKKLKLPLASKDTPLIERVAIPELNHNDNHPLNTSRTLTRVQPYHVVTFNVPRCHPQRFYTSPSTSTSTIPETYNNHWKSQHFLLTRQDFQNFLLTPSFRDSTDSPTLP